MNRPFAFRPRPRRLAIALLLPLVLAFAGHPGCAILRRVTPGGGDDETAARLPPVLLPTVNPQPAPTPPVGPLPPPDEPAPDEAEATPATDPAPATPPAPRPTSPPEPPEGNGAAAPVVEEVKIDLATDEKAVLADKARADLEAAERRLDSVDRSRWGPPEREKLGTVLGLVDSAREAYGLGNFVAAANLARKARVLADELGGG